MTSNVLLPRRGVLEIQEGGAGSSNWKALALIMDMSLYRLGAVDSSEVEITRFVGRDERTGRLKVIASSRTGGVVTYTAELEIADTKVSRILESVNGKKNLRVRMFTGEYSNPVNYEKIRLLSRAWTKKPMGGFTRDMLNSFEGFEDQADMQKRTFPQDVDALYELDPVVHSKISGTVTTLGISDVISVGFERWAGEVAGENQNNPGNKEFLFVTLKDVSNLPHVFWTANQGASWADNTGTGLTNFDGSGICKAGGNVIISGTGAGGGLAYASFETVKAGTATWTRSTGISAGTVVNSVRAIDSNTVIACGASGAVWISTDGGRSFASAGTAVTANALTKIAVVDSSLQWFGGASGTLVRRYKGVMSLITVSGLAVAINSLAVPPGLGRGTELFIGDAGGNLRVTVNGTATAPTFATRAFDGSGSGAVDGLAFAGDDGELLYLIQSNGSSQSRILRDHSGGQVGNDVEVIGAYTDPANSTFNALAMADLNTGMLIGDVNGGQGYIGLLA